MVGQDAHRTEWTVLEQGQLCLYRQGQPGAHEHGLRVVYVLEYFLLRGREDLCAPAVPLVDVGR